MAQVYSQDGNRLKITTLLDKLKKTGQSDPLLLVAVSGDEYVSQPFEYTLTVWRDTKLGHAYPEQLINTDATFGILIEEKTQDWVEQQPDSIEKTLQEIQDIKSYAYRCGRIISFTYESMIEQRFYQYKITMVPYFKILSFETCFRIYENKTLLDIMTDFQNIFSPDLAIDTTKLKKEHFPVMEYCVQFGESSFNFLSRLMARFGVWYYFDHDVKSKKTTLILGQLNYDFKFSDISINDPDKADQLTQNINVAKLVVRANEQSLLSITNFDYQYTTRVRWVRTGDYNTLVPKSYFTGSEALDGSHDWVDPATNRGPKPGQRTPPSDQSRFKTEVFPQSAESNQQAGDDAKDDMWPNEATAIVAKGSSRNPAFLPGYEFHLVGQYPPGVNPQDSSSPDVVDDLWEHDDTPKQYGVPAVKDYVITYNKLAAKEDAYHSHQGALGAIGDFFTKFWNNLIGKNDPYDVMANFTNQGLNNYLQNALPYLPFDPFNQPRSNPGQPQNPLPYFFPYFFGGGLAAASAVVPALVTTIKDAAGGPENNFSNSFSAIPLDWTVTPRSLPLPASFVNPVAAGPQLALVIGSEGTRKLDYNCVYADALGRVRVRFPWQWLGEPVDQRKYNTDKDTCWVRPSHAWAGHRYGWQHVPRVGEEVVVSFIGGDPDRPIITGRVYNADDAANHSNPPFIDEAKIEKLTDLPPTARSSQPYSGLRTNSIPSISEEGRALPVRYHLLRFDDTYSKEQYLIRSQGRLDITVFNHRYENVSRDRNMIVGGKCVKDGKPISIGGDYITKIFRHYNLHVGDPLFPTQSGNRTTLLEQSERLKIKKDSLLSIGGNWSTAVSGDYYLHVGTPTSGGHRTTILEKQDDYQVKGNLNQNINGNWSTRSGGEVTIDANGMETGGDIVLNATMNITLMSGNSSIVITPDSISLIAPQIIATDILNFVPPMAVPDIVEPIDPTAPTVNDPQVPPPQEPTSADSGSSLEPPQWQK
jgi:uncharacterized protein involved in type VI secretion and phage assembly